MKDALTNIISLLFILLFLYTGQEKLMNHQLFTNTLQESLPVRDAAYLFAWGLPIIELTIGISLFVAFLTNKSRLRTKSLYAAGILMSLFSGYVAYMLTCSSHRACTCGGFLQQMTWHQHLYFNMFFTLLAFTGIWLSKSSITFQ